MKYKLINKQTKEETLCDKVIINGFDYYVSDAKIFELNPNDKYYTIVENPRRVVQYYKHIQSKDNVIIATNNLNIDIPKVVDEVEIKVDEILNKELPNFTPYHRRSFFLGYNKSQETHPFSEEDMIEFLNWIRDNTVFDSAPKPYHRKTQTRLSQEELLQLWKEQKPKIVYYE